MLHTELTFCPLGGAKSMFMEHQECEGFIIWNLNVVVLYPATVMTAPVEWMRSFQTMVFLINMCV